MAPVTKLSNVMSETRISYPWEKWFSSFTTVLRRGRDYFCDTRMMRYIIRNNASRRGISVKTIVQKTKTSECIVIYPQLER